MEWTPALVLDRIVVPLLVTVSAWLLKDVIIGLYVARREETRKEWQFRLREVYQPLFLWSGIVLFNHRRKVGGYGITELAQVLAIAVTLVPMKHYYVFVRLLEKASDQSTTAPSVDELKRARDFVYSQIEVLNFALFQQSDLFNPALQTDGFSTLRAIFRVSVAVAIQLVVWAGLALAVFAVYQALSGRPVAMIGLLFICALVIIAECVRRYKLASEIKRRMCA